MSNLNDFFEKKDKKKSKGIKFNSLNDIDKKLQEMDKKRAYQRKKLEDKDWREFEEKKIDYRGLKIHNTIVVDQEDDEENELSNENKEFIPPCPWSTISHDSSSDVNCSKNELSIIKQQVYVPPHLRQKPSLFHCCRNQTVKGKIEKGNDLKISDKEMFPDLCSNFQMLNNNHEKHNLGDEKCPINRPGDKDPMKFNLSERFKVLQDRNEY